LKACHNQAVTAGPVDALIREGHDAYQRGDAELSYRAFRRAADESPTGQVFEGLAKASHLAFDYRRAVDAYERAYAAYRQEGNVLGAARAARTIGWFRGSIYGDWAVYAGWIGRARTLLEQAEEASNEHGWALVAQAQGGSDLREQKRLYLEAINKARTWGDSDLECEALASLGIMLVFSGFRTA
jgi:tetratricopeptide (TPR) repeat protein